MLRDTFLPIVLLVLGSTASSQVTQPSPHVMLFGGTSEIDIDLGDLGQDMELDPVRQLLYVSVPARNEVVVISTNSFEIVDRVFVGTRPYGIDLSADGTTLYAALNSATSVAYLDLDTRTVVDTVVLGTLLGAASTYDVIEAQPYRILASANPSSSGFAYIVQIDRANGNELRRVANSRIIRCAPTFAGSPDGLSAYVGECFSPNSLYKLSLSSLDAPIVLEDQHGAVSGTDHLEVSPDGSRIYLRSGQVLRTSDFTQVGSIAIGPSRLSADGSLAYIATQSTNIDIYDTTTMLKVGDLQVPCAPAGFGGGDLLLLPDDRGIVTLTGGRVCGLLFGEVFSLAVSPASGDFLTTQLFDAVLRIDAGELRITSIRAFLDDVEVGPGVSPKAVLGATVDGMTTVRLPELQLAADGSHRFRAEVALANGAQLTAVADWRSILAREFGPGKLGKQ